MASAGSAVASMSLPSARDFTADAKVSIATMQPIVVLVSLAGCPHCENVRRSHLLPLLAGSNPNSPIIRQIELNGADTVVDFSGATITHAEYARRFNVKLAPVVFFFSPQGMMLAEPLEGAMIPDFYGAYFDAALEKARLKMQPQAKSERAIP
jgi:thioredoxin-related protein